MVALKTPSAHAPLGAREVHEVELAHPDLRLLVLDLRGLGDLDDLAAVQNRH
jgi:hypothetical protein